MAKKKLVAKTVRTKTKPKRPKAAVKKKRPGGKRKKTSKQRAARPSVKKQSRLTLKDRLSRMTYVQACKLLGEDGADLIRRPLPLDDFHPRRDLYLGDDLMRFTMRDYSVSDERQEVIVSITTMKSAPSRLHLHCSLCSSGAETSVACRHTGTAMSFILEEKTLLGLAETPDLETPMELLSEKQLVRRALHERKERSKSGVFRVKNIVYDKKGISTVGKLPKSPWSDYLVTNRETGKTYRVALRGTERGESFCTCPDFRANRLGTCKHIMFMLHWIQRRFSAKARETPHRNTDAHVHVRYGEELTLHLALPDEVLEKAAVKGRKSQDQKHAAKLVKVAKPLLEGPIDDVRGLMRAVDAIEKLGQPVIIYPDAEEVIERRLHEERIKDLTDAIRRNPAEHPLRTQLLKVELLPYQLDGIAFVAGKGRAVLADDMGLGKTIQGIGVAELLARMVDIRKVLIICPASVKSQWRNEIGRFSHRTAEIVIGSAKERYHQYDNGAFFTICNYEQVLRDMQAIERADWDLIILDEGQRIKNWESQTAKAVKSLKSTFALVLSGTPLENRIDELLSVLQFVDERRLPPAYRFFHRHRIVDERGKVKGYKRLDDLREQLNPVLLRRTRASVLMDLPERTTEIVRVPQTAEQMEIHDSNMRIVAQIARKPYFTEIDLRRLQMALQAARMACDSTFLVNKETPAYSGKLERFRQVVQDLFAEPDRKAVLFSEWTTMLDLIEPILAKEKLDYVRLDGSVPQKKRQQLVAQFHDDPDIRLFLTTNAGAVGLNLQAADTVINMDLPWNPAVLEQRIGRAHRMGQQRNVQVFLFVTDDSIEENMLGTLSAKHDLSEAALDMDSEVSTVQFESGVEEMRRRLEVLLGAKPPAPVDASQGLQMQEQTMGSPVRSERIASTGGELAASLMKFAGELFGEEAVSRVVTSLAEGSPSGDNGDGTDSKQTDPIRTIATNVGNRLASCVEEQENGESRLSIPIPDPDTIRHLANGLAQLFAADKE